MAFENVGRGMVLMPFHHEESYVLCPFYHTQFWNSFQVSDSKHLNNVIEGQ